ncbi:MAG: ABC transporter ATP-binding protein [Candidatus Edwardsbacteria bacterium]
MIEIQNLYKKFHRQKVLQGVNLTIERGETLVIIGRSGCGKSVLLKHLIGLLKPDHGSILVDGVDVAEVNKSELFELRRRFGMLFQGSALFDSMTVGENVGLGLQEHTDLSLTKISEMVKEKLALVGLIGVENMRPAELSGGMKKRVGLARAIAMEPEYILYDEPTTGLDPIMADQINNLIIELRKKLGITSIAVTHDMVSAYKIADRIAMLHEGKVIYIGTPEEIQKADNPLVQQFIRGEAD